MGNAYFNDNETEKTYIFMQEPQGMVEIICGEEVLVVTCQDIFDALGKLLRSVGEDAHE